MAISSISAAAARPAALAVSAVKAQEAEKKPQYDRYTAAEETAPKSIAEAMQEAREQAAEAAEKYKVRIPVRYGDFPMEAYARLGRARTKADASAAAGYARRTLCRLRAALRQDPEAAGSIRCAMRQLEKVALRANRKKMDMDREHLLQLRARRAAEEARRRESARLHTELQRRRTVRIIRESGYFHETAVAMGFQAYQDAVNAQCQADISAAASATAAGAGVEFSAQA